MNKLKLIIVSMLVLFACKPAPIDFMVRPDTRQMYGIAFNTPIRNQIIQLFSDSMPNETGFCAKVQIVQDSLFREGLLITEIIQAKQDSANPVGIHYTPKKLIKIAGKKYTKGIGCEDIPFLIGFGHDHPTTRPTWPCTASDNDAQFLAGDIRYLFILSFCQDGRFEVLWQDGRRQYGLWRF